MLSPMIPVLILLSWLRDVGASGELCDVTGRLPGDKIELDFPGRRLGGGSAEDGAAVRSATAAPQGTLEKQREPQLQSLDAATPLGDSKLRLLAISSLPGLFNPSFFNPTAASNPTAAFNPLASNPVAAFNPLNSNPAAGVSPVANSAPATSTFTTPAAIIPGDLILIIGQRGELIHAGTVTTDGRLAHIPLGAFREKLKDSDLSMGPSVINRSKNNRLTTKKAENVISRQEFYRLTTPQEIFDQNVAPRRVSVRSLAAYCARWRKAAGVMVLRKPWLPYHYTKREVLIPMRDGVRLYTAIYEPYGEDAAAFSGSPVKNARKCKTPLCSGVGGPSKSVENEGAPSCNASEVGPRPIVLMRSPYPVGTYGYGGPGDLSDKIRCFTERGYIIVEQNVRGSYMSEGEFEDVRPLIHDLYACSVTGQAQPPTPVRLQHHRSDQDPHTCAPVASQATTSTPTDESTDAYDTIDWLLENTRNNGSVGIYGVSYPGFYATCAAVCGHPALKIVSPQAQVTDWWMGDDAHHNGALMLCDMYGFGASFFRPKGNPTPDSAESLSAIPDDADLYTWFRGKPLSDLLAPLKVFADIVAHPDYDAFWQERNPLRHLKNVKPAVLVVGGLYDAEDAWGPEHTLAALRRQSPGTEVYGIFGPWTHGGWRKDPDFLERIEAPIFEYYLEGKGGKPAWRDLLIPTQNPGENLTPGKEFLTDVAQPAPAESGSGQGVKIPQSVLNPQTSERRFAIAPGRYLSDPTNPVPYMEGESPWRDKAYMWGDQRFAAARPDVLMQVLEGDLKEDYLAVGPVHVELKFSVAPVQDSAPALDLDIVVKLIDIAPDGTMSLVRGDVCPARWRNAIPAASTLASTAASTPASSSPGSAAAIAPAPLIPGAPATLSFDLASICHCFAAGHSIALQIQSSWFPLVAMNPQTFLENPHTATTKDYRPVEVSILDGSSIVLGWSRTR